VSNWLPTPPEWRDPTNKDTPFRQRASLYFQMSELVSLGSEFGKRVRFVDGRRLGNYLSRWRDFNAVPMKVSITMFSGPEGPWPNVSPAAEALGTRSPRFRSAGGAALVHNADNVFMSDSGNSKVPHLRCSLSEICVGTQRFRGWAHVWPAGLRPSQNVNARRFMFHRPAVPKARSDL
jgi:hypothetical protein